MHTAYRCVAHYNIIATTGLLVLLLLYYYYVLHVPTRVLADKNESKVLDLFFFFDTLRRLYLIRFTTVQNRS